MVKFGGQVWDSVQAQRDAIEDVIKGGSGRWYAGPLGRKPLVANEVNVVEQMHRLDCFTDINFGLEKETMLPLQGVPEGPKIDSEGVVRA